MNDRPTNEPTSPLERSVKALRGMDVPAGPSEELIAKTVARLGAGAMGISPETQRKGWWTVKKVKATIWAAGLAAAAMVFVAWLVWGSGGKVAFADVVEQVRSAKAMRCKLTLQMPGQKPQTSEALMAPPWMIVSMPAQDMRMIWNIDKGVMMMLNGGMKQATVMNMKDMPANPQQSMNLLEAFGKLDAKSGKPLEDREIGGKKYPGFEAKEEARTMKVWADPKTNLPVLVEMTEMTESGFEPDLPALVVPPENGGATAQAGAPAAATAPASGTKALMGQPLVPDVLYTFSDFDWNPTVDPAELSLEAPKGYQMMNVDVDASASTEKDIVPLLKAFADLNKGVFPDDLDMGYFMKLLATDLTARESAETKGMTAEQKQKWLSTMMPDLMKVTMPMSRASTFINDAKNGTDWRYNGKGVKVGEKSRAILWYKPARGTGWRVFDADLTVHDAKEAPAGGVPVKVMNMADVIRAATTQTAPRPTTLPATMP